MSRKRNYGKKAGGQKNEPKEEYKGTASENKTGEESSKGTSGSSTEEKGSSYSKTGMNDPEWYKKDPKLFEDVSRINFSDVLGSPVDQARPISWGYVKDGELDQYQVNEQHANAIPGILTVVTKPSFGWSRNITDPLNVCANAFYTHVRYVNSGRKNYDPADLMLYALAISELYGFVMWCQRTYGYAFMYSQRNNYVGRDLIIANNVDGGIVNQLADFRAWLNTFINKVSSFAVPADISIFKRRAFMYASLYTESATTNIKDQLYQFAPDGFYRFTLDDTGKGMLTYCRFDDIYGTGHLLNLAEIQNFADMLMAEISGDEDFGLMSGDIIKAYGSNTLALGSVPDEYYVLPVYEEFVLSQIRNATLVNVNRGAHKEHYRDSPDATETFASSEIMQDTKGNLVYNEFFIGGYDNVNVLKHKLLTLTNPEPTVDDVMEGTRLMVGKANELKNYFMVDNSTAQNSIYSTPLICGSDIVVELRVTQHKWLNNNWVSAKHIITKQVIGQASSLENEYNDLLLLFFHWAPANTIVSVHDDTIEGVHYVDSMYQLANVDNYTVLAPYTLQKLHEVALLSLVYVPGVAKMINFAG